MYVTPARFQQQGLRKAFCKNLATYTFTIAAHSLLLAFREGGASKKCCVQNAIPTAMSKAGPFFFFCANMHQVHSDDAPPSELQATESFSQDCALSLSARMSPDDARFNIC